MKCVYSLWEYIKLVYAGNNGLTSIIKRAYAYNIIASKYEEQYDVIYIYIYLYIIYNIIMFVFR